jgi:hypothetical protein
MENWRLKGLMEAARNLATGLENMAGEHVEPSPPPPPGAEEPRPPLTEWWRRLNQLEARLQALEERSPQSSPLPLRDGGGWFRPAPGTHVLHCGCLPASLAEMIPPSATVTTVFFRLTPSTASGSEET